MIAQQSLADEKGITFQATLRDNTNALISATGVGVTAQILSPDGCVLREETLPAATVTNGYLSLTLLKGTAQPIGSGGKDPGLTTLQVFDNSAARTGLVCVNSDGTVNGGDTSFDPAVSGHARKLRLLLTLPAPYSDSLIADFNMRSMGFAANADALSGKVSTDFVNVNAGQSLTQANAESIFSRFTKLDAILNNFNAGGTTYSGNITGSAASVTGTVGIANGGTGATTQGGAANAILPSQTGNSGKYLTTDGTNVTWSAVAGGVTSVASKTGAVTLVAADITDFATEVDARITTNLSSYVAKAGDTMTGTLTLPSNGLVVGTNQLIVTAGNVGVGTASPNAKFDVKGSIVMSGATSGYTGFAPASAAGSTVWTLPSSDGTNGQILTTNGSGVLSWSTGASAGMSSLNGSSQAAQTFATPGTSGTAPAWSTNTGTGVHTLNIPMASTATVTAGLLSKSDYDSFAAKLDSSASFAGDVSGAYNTTSVDKIKGKAVSPAAYATGQTLRYNGTDWVNALLNISSDITGTLPVANGGTGATTLGSGNLLVGAGTSAVTSLAAGTAGNVVYASGIATWASATPDTAGLVDKSSTQTLTGAKAFSNYIRMNAQNEVRFADSDSSNYVALRSPATVGTDVTWTLPSADGTSGQVLSTNGSGTLSWATSGAALSALTAAGATNTIDNTNYAQTWNWSTATTQNLLSSNANALTTGSMLSLATSNASVNSTNGLLYVANTSAGTSGMIARFQSNSTAGSGLTVLASGNVGVATSAPGSKLSVAGDVTIANAVAGTVAAIVQGASGQTANLQQWKNFAGTVLAYVSSAGDFVISSGNLVISAQNATDGGACTTVGSISRDATGDLFLCK